MVSCEYCGESAGKLAFRCDYCDNSFCQAHRLPESHECDNISATRPPTKGSDEPEAFVDTSRGASSTDDLNLAQLRERARSESTPYSVLEVDHTVGTTPEPDYDSSPDVAVDGSIARDTDSQGSERTEEQTERSLSKIGLLVAALLFLLLLGLLLF